MASERTELAEARMQVARLTAERDAALGYLRTAATRLKCLEPVSGANLGERVLCAIDALLDGAPAREAVRISDHGLSDDDVLVFTRAFGCQRHSGSEAGRGDCLNCIENGLVAFDKHRRALASTGGER